MTDKKNIFLKRYPLEAIILDTPNSREITTKTGPVYIANVNISRNIKKQHKKLLPNGKGNNFLYFEGRTAK